MKKLISLLCMTACLLSLAACTTDGSNVQKLSAADAIVYNAVFSYYVEGISETSDEEAAEIIANKGAVYNEEAVIGVGILYPVWKGYRDEVGNFVQVLEMDNQIVGDTVVLTGKVDYSVRDANVKMTFDKDGVITGFSIEPIYTWGEKMSKAGLNTLIGILVVFAVLILISLLISCFKYINNLETAIRNKKEDKAQVAEEGMNNTIAQIVKKEEEELVDDLELAAVISAAVAAYTGTSADGFVVRSIRKSNKKRWQNA
ncbi:MAG: OadG family protein [Alistipes sp.]|nr:OadG family protein [Alistipes sp.]